MKAKISNFLQSDAFILAIALFMGFLCHIFVNTEVLAPDKNVQAMHKNKVMKAFFPHS